MPTKLVVSLKRPRLTLNRKVYVEERRCQRARHRTTLVQVECPSYYSHDLDARSRLPRGAECSYTVVELEKDIGRLARGRGSFSDGMFELDLRPYAKIAAERPGRQLTIKLSATLGRSDPPITCKVVIKREVFRAITPD